MAIWCHGCESESSRADIRKMPLVAPEDAEHAVSGVGDSESAVSGAGGCGICC